MPVLEAYNVCKTYRDGGFDLIVANHIYLPVEAGNFIVISGSSGSGKTTLLKMLGGLVRPDSGEVYFQGDSIYEFSDQQAAEYRRVCAPMIYQNYNLLSALNVEENITLPFLLAKKRWKPEVLEEVLEKMELDLRRNAYPEQLSGGQQQRVAIARALLCQPPILLADEPTGNLDSRNGALVMGLLERAVREFSCALVMVTHNPKFMERADVAYEMENGTLWLAK